MQLSVIGIGAAGNKASIKLIENHVLSRDNVTLVNTNLKDIPSDYKDISVQFPSVTNLEGSGKEPSNGRKSILYSIKTGKINVAELAKFADITSNDKAIILVTSTEGGTGSGATPIIAKYFIAMGYPVHVFALFGFKEDPKSIKNTLQFLNSIDDDVILHVIKNYEFLDYTNNYSKAENLANEYFSQQVSILTGDWLIPSAQNIDSADLFGATTTSRYMDIEYVSLSGVKNIETFNKAVKDVYENNKGFRYEKTAKKLAVIINAPEDMSNSIDFRFEVAKRYIGEPYKIYKQIQNDPNQKPYIVFIASGINYPEKEIMELEEEYKQAKDRFDSSSNSMSDLFKNMDFDDDMDEFENKPKSIANSEDINKMFGELINTDKKDIDEY